MFGFGQIDPWPIERQWRVKDDGRAIDAVLDLLAEPVHLIAHSGGDHFAYPVIRARSDQILTIEDAGHLSPFTHVPQVAPLVRRHLAADASGGKP